MSATRTIHVVALQPALRFCQPMVNLHLLRKLVDAACAEARADVIVLPEVFNGMPAEGGGAPEHEASARQFLATLARAAGAVIVGGSLECTDSDGTRRNTCYVVDRDGHELGAYHKRMMFAAEQTTRTAGREAGIFETGGLQLGVLICADLWEPAYARELIDRVDLLCVPAKTTVPGEGHTDYARRLWWSLALTRAMENGLPVAVSDWSCARQEASLTLDGRPARQVHYTSGGASLVDPGRRPHVEHVQRTLPRGKPGVLRADIDLDAVARFRDYRRTAGLLPRPRP